MSPPPTPPHAVSLPLTPLVGVGPILFVDSKGFPRLPFLESYPDRGSWGLGALYRYFEFLNFDSQREAVIY